MTTLEDAWHWYEETKSLLKVIKRLADKHWDTIWNSEPCRADLDRDDRLNTLDGPPLSRNADLGLKYLDDQAIVFLFSVFESLVRSKVSAAVETEIPGLRHPVIVSAAKEAKHNLDRGRFAKVLNSMKSIDHDLVEQVRQVRRYRNWVSHGCRGPAPFRLDPKAAYDRLSVFLKRIGQSEDDEGSPITPTSG